MLPCRGGASTRCHVRFYTRHERRKGIECAAKRENYGSTNEIVGDTKMINNGRSRRKNIGLGYHEKSVDEKPIRPGQGSPFLLRKKKRKENSCHVKKMIKEREGKKEGRDIYQRDDFDDRVNRANSVICCRLPPARPDARRPNRDDSFVTITPKVDHPVIA